LKVLAIETSGTIGSVAACEDDAVQVALFFERGMTHGRELVPKLDEALGASGWALGEVELVAVSQGPGSYTGLRVGITCAKMLAHFGRTPLIGVSSLDVLARNAPRHFASICPVIDAKRQQVYTAVYEAGEPGEGDPVRRSDLLVLRPAEVLERLKMPAFVFGSGLRAHREAFGVDGVTLGGEDSWRARASQVGLLGATRFARSGGQDPLQLAPIYLRRPEAEEKWEQRTPSL